MSPIHTYIIKIYSHEFLVNGKLYTWGNNSKGQLGLGNNESSRAPALVEALDGVPLASAVCGGLDLFYFQVHISIPIVKKIS